MVIIIRGMLRKYIRSITNNKISYYNFDTLFSLKYLYTII